jgi:hypothetical protein
MERLKKAIETAREELGERKVYQKQIKQAYDYFAKIRKSPDADDILDFVLDQVADAEGMTVAKLDKNTVKAIKKEIEGA